MRETQPTDTIRNNEVKNMIPLFRVKKTYRSDLFEDKGKYFSAVEGDMVNLKKMEEIDALEAVKTTPEVLSKQEFTQPTEEIKPMGKRVERTDSKDPILVWLEAMNLPLTKFKELEEYNIIKEKYKNGGKEFKTELVKIIKSKDNLRPWLEEIMGDGNLSSN